MSDFKRKDRKRDHPRTARQVICGHSNPLSNKLFFLLIILLVNLSGPTK